MRRLESLKLSVSLGQRLKTQIVLVGDYMVLPDSRSLKAKRGSGKRKADIAGMVASLTKSETGVLR